MPRIGTVLFCLCGGLTGVLFWLIISQKPGQYSAGGQIALVVAFFATISFAVAAKRLQNRLDRQRQREVNPWLTQ